MKAQFSKPIGNYSPFHSLDVGDGILIFVSGQVPVDAHGNTIGNTMAEQAECVFRNLEGVLALNHAALAHIAKVTIFLRDMKDFDQFNIVRNRYFEAHRPASTLVQVAALARPEHLVEIDAIAYVAKASSPETA